MSTAFPFDVETVASDEDPALFLDDVRNEDRDVFRNPDAGVGISLEDAERERVAFAPEVKDWKDVPDDFVAVHFNEAVNKVWDQAQAEVSMMFGAFENLFGTKQPSMKQLVDYMTGPTSDLFRAFNEELKWTHDAFSKFLKTFCVQAACQVSVKGGWIPKDRDINGRKRAHTDVERRWCGVASG